MVLNSFARTWRAIYASVPASSTPVGPAPTTTKFSSLARTPRAASLSGQLKCQKTRRRISVASSTRLQPWCQRLPLVMPKVSVARTRCHNQVIIGNLIVASLTTLRSRSKPVTSPNRTSAFFCECRIQRIGAAISPGEAQPSPLDTGAAERCGDSCDQSAYTLTSAFRNCRAALRPPKPLR